MEFDELFQIYKIGRELGLSKKEIINTIISKQNRPLLFFIILIIVISLIAVFAWTIGFISISRENTTYARGTLYSTVNVKDFDDEK